MKIVPKSKEDIFNELINSVPEEAFSVINELLLSKYEAKYSDIVISYKEIQDKCKELDINFQIFKNYINGIILSYRKLKWSIYISEDNIIFS